MGDKGDYMNLEATCEYCGKPMIQEFNIYFAKDIKNIDTPVILHKSCFERLKEFEDVHNMRSCVNNLIDL